MTIEEFREFGWKAGMRIITAKGKDEVDAVFFNHQTVVGDVDTFLDSEIIGIDNPDGTVAWRAK